MALVGGTGDVRVRSAQRRGAFGTSTLPADFAGGDKALYAKAVGDTKPMFTSDGVMPAGGPETVLEVLGSFNPNVKGKESSIDLSKTYTTEFVAKARG